jgi:hypothetical protein
MRKLMITVTMVAVGLGGVAACADNSTPSPGASGGASSSTTAADQTREVCAEAISTGTTATAAIQAKVIEASQALAANDQAKITQILADVRKSTTDWATKLTELSNKQVSPAVKTALTDGATTLSTLGVPTDAASAAAAQTKLAEIGTKITAACK